jgi:mitochondrial Rho GTPase 1
MRLSIRVVLVGDSSVGKSSIVSSLIKDQFVQVPKNSTLPQVTIPLVLSLTLSSPFDAPLKCPSRKCHDLSRRYFLSVLNPRHLLIHSILHLISIARPEDLPKLQLELKKAHVVCIVYSIDDAKSWDRVGAYWLPLLRSVGVNVPVILVGNKIDLRSGKASNQALEDGKYLRSSRRSSS